MKARVNIVYCIDFRSCSGDDLKLLITSVYSLNLLSTEPVPFHVHLVYSGESADTLDRLNMICSHVYLHLHSSDKVDNSTKYFLYRFIPHAARVLYIDFRTVAVSGITDLFFSDMKGKPCSVVLNPSDTSEARTGIILFDHENWVRSAGPGKIKSAYKQSSDDPGIHVLPEFANELPYISCTDLHDMTSGMVTLRHVSDFGVKYNTQDEIISASMIWRYTVDTYPWSSASPDMCSRLWHRLYRDALSAGTSLHYSYSDANPFVMALPKVLHKAFGRITHSDGKSASVMLSGGTSSDGNMLDKIFFGAGIYSSEGMLGSTVVASSGPRSSDILGLTDVPYFNSLLLIPWAYDIVRRSDCSGECYIPSVDHMDVFKNTGIDNVNPWSTVRTQLTVLSMCNSVVTDSVYVIAAADALGVTPRVFRKGNEITRDEFDDYMEITGREFRYSDIPVTGTCGRVNPLELKGFRLPVNTRATLSRLFNPASVDSIMKYFEAGI